MAKLICLIFILCCISKTFAVPIGDLANEPSTSTHSDSTTVDNTYVPHATFPYSETYPNAAYESYLVPAGPVYQPEKATAVVPFTTGIWSIIPRVGLTVFVGVAGLVFGAAAVTGVCYFTPLCNIEYKGFKSFNHDTMRSLVSPANINKAASFVQDAVDKYQRLQRAVGSY